MNVSGVEMRLTIMIVRNAVIHGATCVGFVMLDKMASTLNYRTSNVHSKYRI
jgi:hypothetical protein